MPIKLIEELKTISVFQYTYYTPISGLDLLSYEKYIIDRLNDFFFICENLHVNEDYSIHLIDCDLIFDPTYGDYYIKAKFHIHVFNSRAYFYFRYHSSSAKLIRS